MYSYEFDAETGGILLNDSDDKMSKEPRPVYAQEMDFLGMNRYWHYEKQQDYPYLWAEASNYWYGNQIVARANGGALDKAPSLELLKDMGTGKDVRRERISQYRNAHIQAYPPSYSMRSVADSP